jgi:hypothetical protein
MVETVFIDLGVCFSNTTVILGLLSRYTDHVLLQRPQLVIMSNSISCPHPSALR